MKKVLLINLPYFEDIFSRSNVRSAVSPGIIVLGLASIAAPVREKGHAVRILDLNIDPEPGRKLDAALKEFAPDIVGIPVTTPLVFLAAKIVGAVKAALPNATVVLGGPHASAVPEDTLRTTGADIAVIGEGDETFLALVEGRTPESLPGVAWRAAGGEIAVSARTEYIRDLNALPYPALDLFDIPRYRYPRVTAVANPVASLETSRGCFSKCVYCNKNIFGHKFRTKTPARVVDEMEHVLGLGFREIHIVDDGFTTDLKRAAAVCDEILRRGLRFPWYVRGGVRVDRVTPELLSKMRRAGCYRIPFGIESGDQRVLDRIKKGITLEQVRNAVRWAKEAGMIVDAYFMLGLPGDTRETVEKTIALACSLPADYAKFAITVPLPGTEFYEELEAAGRLKTRDWAKFNFSVTPAEVYDHELDWEYIERKYHEAYRRFYFRPSYIVRSAVRGLMRGELPAYIQAFFSMKT